MQLISAHVRRGKRVKASPLPTPKETGIGTSATKASNQAVSRVLSPVNESVKKKRKVYTAFTDQQRAAIGKYTAECGNAAALRKYQQEKYLILVKAPCVFSSVSWNS